MICPQVSVAMRLPKPASASQYANAFAWHSSFGIATPDVFSAFGERSSPSTTQRESSMYPRRQRHSSAGASSTFDGSGTYLSEYGDSSTFCGISKHWHLEGSLRNSMKLGTEMGYVYISAFPHCFVESIVSVVTDYSYRNILLCPFSCSPCSDPSRFFATLR